MIDIPTSMADGIWRWAAVRLAKNLRFRLRKIDSPTGSEGELIYALTSFLRENNVSDEE